uniref:Uncharacterized protein n=1 Tax=Panagrolaimus sp. JU765 TaxID=591449 RepID=A0AC34Q691_9BILA
MFFLSQLQNMEILIFFLMGKFQNPNNQKHQNSLFFFNVFKNFCSKTFYVSFSRKKLPQNKTVSCIIHSSLWLHKKEKKIFKKRMIEKQNIKKCGSSKNAHPKKKYKFPSSDLLVE